MSIVRLNWWRPARASGLRAEHAVLTLSVCFLVGLLTGLPGCSAPRPEVPLGRLYDRAARTHDDLRNPVILIPGLMGSRLVDGDGLVVWGQFRGEYADPEEAEGARRIALPMQKGRPLADLRDSTVAGAPLDRIQVSIFGIDFVSGAYANILSALGIGNYLTADQAPEQEVDYGSDHFTCFEFGYDWRRSNAENAHRLHQFILEKRREVQAEIERRYGIADHEVRFDLVAHSMGSLLARYYLRYGGAPLPQEGPVPAPTWDGARYVDLAVLVAPPNLGAPQTIIDLLEGKDFGFLLPRYDPAVLGTMPSLYELLPRQRHAQIIDGDGHPIGDLYEVERWEAMRWGLADPRSEEILHWLLPDVMSARERSRIALDHLGKCLRNAERFAWALDQPATPPPELTTVLIAGDAIETPETIRVKGRQASIASKGPGDGTVLRRSALADERVEEDWRPSLRSSIAWDQVFFLPESHLDLTKSQTFVDNLLYLLIEAPRPPRTSTPRAGSATQ